MSVCSRQLATDGDGQNRCGSAFGGTFRDSDRPERAHESEKPPGGLIGFIDIEPPVTVLYADVCVLRFVPDGANPQVFSCQTGVRLSGDVTVIFSSSGTSTAAERISPRSKTDRVMIPMPPAADGSRADNGATGQ